MADPESPGSGDAAESAAARDAKKPKRVRTGCLTCRERHLKCDEGLPSCQNCKKSGKTCRRGMRVTFHRLSVKDPAILPPTADWSGMCMNSCWRRAWANCVYSAIPRRVETYCVGVPGRTGEIPPPGPRRHTSCRGTRADKSAAHRLQSGDRP
jgi:hypothetical protein